MTTHSLLDDFEYSGNWWLPGRREDAVGGTVSYSDGMLMLRLFEPFPKRSSGTPTDDEIHPQIILGRSRGTEITLYKARGLYMHPAQMNRITSIVPRYLLVGKHIDAQDVALTSMSVRFTHLEEWVASLPFETDPRGGPSGLGSIDYDPPKPIQVDLVQKDCHLEITHSSTPSMGDYRSIRWQHSAWIAMSTPEPEQIDWYFETTMSLAQILSLLVGRRVTLIATRGRVFDEEESPERALVRGDISIFRNGYDRPAEDEREMSRLARVLVPLPALGPSVGDVLDSWFEHAERAQPVYNLFLAVLGSRSIYVEFAFLALTQALDGFHRRFVRPAAPSLGVRLTELLATLSGDVRALVCEDPEEFTEGVRVTRNYLTHYFDEGEESEGWANDFPALSEGTYRLRRMFAALLWQQMGIESTVIRDAVSRIDIDPYQPADRSR